MLCVNKKKVSVGEGSSLLLLVPNDARSASGLGEGLRVHESS